MNMGNTLLKQAKYEEAFESYRQVQKLRPDFALTHYNLGVAYAKRGQREKAEKEFVRALELNPDFSEAQKTLDAVRNEMKPS
jgi:Flp pilus assembly protein TadD